MPHRRLRPDFTFLSFYTDALTANGVEFDVYDVDANGRTAPDNVGVLSYYDAVIFYTGNDVVTREPGWGGGNASRLAMQELNELRDFMNEGGGPVHGPARRAAVHQRGRGAGLRPVREQAMLAPTLRSSLAACRSLARAMGRGTSSSTGSERRSPPPVED